eukprot:gene19884-26587_t
MERRHRAGFLLCLFISLQLTLTSGQQASDRTLDYAVPICSSTQYWDTSTLRCSSCPSPSYVAADGRSCQSCDSSTGIFYVDDDGYQKSLTWTAAVLTGATTCACANSTASLSIISDIKDGGLMYQRCVSCPANSISINGVCTPQTPPYETELTPQEAYARAVASLPRANIPPYSTTSFPKEVACRGGAYAQSPAVLQSFPKEVACRGGAYAQSPAVLQARFPSGAESGALSGLQVPNSYPLSTLLGPAALACLTTPYSRQNCNALANLCVLQMYDNNQASCRFYDAIVEQLNPNIGGTTNLQNASSPLPWLYYPDTTYLEDPNVGISYQFNGDAIDLTLPTDEKQVVSVVQLVLSAYTLNGTWIGYTNFTKQFQLCGADKWEAGNWMNFGWESRNKCKVTLDEAPQHRAEAHPSTGYEAGPSKAEAQHMQGSRPAQTAEAHTQQPMPLAQHRRGQHSRVGAQHILRGPAQPVLGTAQRCPGQPSRGPAQPGRGPDSRGRGPAQPRPRTAPARPSTAASPSTSIRGPCTATGRWPITIGTGTLHQTGIDTLYPVPVVPNVVPSTIHPTGTVRRFFYTDGSLGTPINPDGTLSTLQVVMYPIKMSLEIILLDDPRNQILPPVLTITYQSQSVSNTATPVKEEVVFEVSYQNNEFLKDQFWRAWRATPVKEEVVFEHSYQKNEILKDQFWRAWRIMLIVFEVVIAFPLFLWKMLMFLRKRRGTTEGADQDLIIYSIVAICDAGSFGLVLVLFFVTLYYLILYKLQATKVDIFLLDWEKPKKVMTRDGSREETSAISAWRTLMIANEFAELQTKRITYPSFTLILLRIKYTSFTLILLAARSFVLLGAGCWLASAGCWRPAARGFVLLDAGGFTTILVGAEVQSAGYINPWDDNFKVYQYGVTSKILRFGIEACFFFVLGLGQYLLVRILYHRYVNNPVTQLVDLAYLANISIIILDEKNSGYYIHGELNDELLKESEGMISNRGFINNYQNNPKLSDNQIFLLFVEDSIPKQYETTMLRQIEAAAQEKRQRRGQLTSFLRGPGNVAAPDSLSSQAEITETFKKMLGDLERDHATQDIKYM